MTTSPSSAVLVVVFSLNHIMNGMSPFPEDSWTNEFTRLVNITSRKVKKNVENDSLLRLRLDFLFPAQSKEPAQIAAAKHPRARRGPMPERELELQAVIGSAAPGDPVEPPPARRFWTGYPPDI